MMPQILHNHSLLYPSGRESLRFMIYYSTVFIQTDLSEAALYFVGAVIRRLRHFLYSDD